MRDHTTPLTDTSRPSFDLSRPLVIVDGQNVCREYTGHVGDFSLEGLFRLFAFCSRQGIQIQVVLPRHRKDTHSINPSHDIHPFVLYVSETLSLRGETDDMYVLKLAQNYDCQWISNDNFRNLSSHLTRVPHLSGLIRWMEQNIDKLKVPFMFDAQGLFTPLMTLVAPGGTPQPYLLEAMSSVRSSFSHVRQAPEPDFFSDVTREAAREHLARVRANHIGLSGTTPLRVEFARNLSAAEHLPAAPVSGLDLPRAILAPHRLFVPGSAPQIDTFTDVLPLSSDQEAYLRAFTKNFTAIHQMPRALYGMFIHSKCGLTTMDPTRTGGNYPNVSCSQLLYFLTKYVNGDLNLLYPVMDCVTWTLHSFWKLGRSRNNFGNAFRKQPIPASISSTSPFRLQHLIPATGPLMAAAFMTFLLGGLPCPFSFKNSERVDLTQLQATFRAGNSRGEVFEAMCTLASKEQPPSHDFRQLPPGPCTTFVLAIFIWKHILPLLEAPSADWDTVMYDGQAWSEMKSVIGEIILPLDEKDIMCPAMIALESPLPTRCGGMVHYSARIALVRVPDGVLEKPIFKGYGSDRTHRYDLLFLESIFSRQTDKADIFMRGLMRLWRTRQAYSHLKSWLPEWMGNDIAGASMPNRHGPKALLKFALSLLLNMPSLSHRTHTEWRFKLPLRTLKGSDLLSRLENALERYGEDGTPAFLASQQCN